MRTYFTAQIARWLWQARLRSLPYALILSQPSAFGEAVTIQTRGEGARTQSGERQ
jgi:hypothetical protein